MAKFRLKNVIPKNAMVLSNASLGVLFKFLHSLNNSTCYRQKRVFRDYIKYYFESINHANSSLPYFTKDARVQLSRFIGMLVAYLSSPLKNKHIQYNTSCVKMMCLIANMLKKGIKFYYS